MNTGSVRRAMQAVLAAAMLGLAFLPATALAQSAPVPPADIPNVPSRALPGPDTAAPGEGIDLGKPQLPETVTPYAPATLLPGLTLPAPTTGVQKGRMTMTAKLTEDGPAIAKGVVWRVFAEFPNADGSRKLVAEAAGGKATFTLEPGAYYVYCGFGYAGTTDRIEVAPGGIGEDNVVLNAGGVRLGAVTRKDRPVPQEDLSFDIFLLETDSRGEPKPVALEVKPGTIIRLAANTYNVVANYGSANATTSADIEVKAGKLSDITLTEKAAKVTLKLVRASGGEAIADTSWTVLTQAGDLVTTGVGAFPSFVLAEGDYTIVAKHQDKTFQRVVTIATGEDREVEVLAAADARPAAATP